MSRLRRDLALAHFELVIDDENELDLFDQTRFYTSDIRNQSGSFVFCIRVAIARSDL